MMKRKKGYAKGGMVTKSGPDRGYGSGSSGGKSYTTLADKTQASPAKPC